MKLRKFFSHDTRELSVLLELMLEHFDKYFSTGLCRLSYDLYDHRIINGSEEKKIREYIVSFYSNYKRFYYWKSGDTSPRIEWLKKRIEIEKEFEKLNIVK